MYEAGLDTFNKIFYNFKKKVKNIAHNNVLNMDNSAIFCLINLALSCNIVQFESTKG